MTDPILLFLAVASVALLLLGARSSAIPVAVSGLVATALSAVCLLFCVPTLLSNLVAGRVPLANAAESALVVPVGPPGLSVHLALDPLAAFFLTVVFLAGTVLTAFQATTPTDKASVRMTTCCLGGTSLMLLAADGVSLAVGLAVTCGTMSLSGTARRGHALLLIPVLLLGAVCLLTPAGFAPRFDEIRASPVDVDHAVVAAILVVAAFGAAFGGLAYNSPGQPDWTRQALIVGVLIPAGLYLLLRLIVDLPGPATPPGCGFILVLGGGGLSVIHAWRGASHPDIDGSVAYLARRQAGLCMAGIGIALIARAADLPSAASYALAAALLLALGGSASGVVALLAVRAMGTGAGTSRLSRLGGLVQSMPGTSAVLAAGLLGLSALPPGIGFAGLWMLFEAIVSAPRTGGLLSQLPLALIAAAMALSASLGTAGSIRLIGVALLGRPRTPQGAGAQESASTSRAILLVMAGLTVLAGLLPGPLLWMLGESTILALTGAPPGALIAPFASTWSSPGYSALPAAAALASASGAALLARHLLRKPGKTVGFWGDGMAPPPGLPFGDPAAQSVGESFLPAFPDLRVPDLRVPDLRVPKFSAVRPAFSRVPSAATGLWLVLAAFGALLLSLAVIGAVAG